MSNEEAMSIANMIAAENGLCAIEGKAPGAFWAYFYDMSEVARAETVGIAHAILSAYEVRTYPDEVERLWEERCRKAMRTYFENRAKEAA